MSPQRLDPDSVDAKLRLMEPLVARLAPLRSASVHQLTNDLDTRLVAERILTVLVDLAVSVNGHVAGAMGVPVPSDYRGSYLAAAQAGAITEELAERLAPSAGLRDLLTHRYGDVDLGRLVAAIPLAHDDYARYIREVSRWLLDRVQTPAEGDVTTDTESG